MLSLGKIIRIMEVDDTLLMSFYYILREKDTVRKVLRDLTCHIVTLCGVDHRVLIRVLLLDLLIYLIYKGKDTVISCI